MSTDPVSVPVEVHAPDELPDARRAEVLAAMRSSMISTGTASTASDLEASSTGS